MLEIPQTTSQFETGYKSLKNNLEAKIEYLFRIEPNNLKKIFRRNMEIDTIIDIIRAFSTKG